MTASSSPAELAELFDSITQQLRAAPDDKAALSMVADLAVRYVDGADYAGITVGRDGGRFETVAATDDIVSRCDQIQYDLGSGPCVDAVVADSRYNAGDLRTDGRWPQFASRCVEQTGIVSMLSMRLFVESDADLIAGLNMYSHQPHAFDENSEAFAHLLATHGALAVGKASAENKTRNLKRALETSRDIGIAMGIVMNSHKVTRDQAFGLLRMASQRTHRKLADIAREITETGALPDAVGGRHQT